MTEIADYRSRLLGWIAENSKGDLRILEFDKMGQAVTGNSNVKDIPTNLRSQVMSIWAELMSSGIIGELYPEREGKTYFVTDIGAKSFVDISRDPLNHSGYMSYLEKITGLSEVAKKYAEEAIRCYQTGCYKSSAVMIGAALESILMEIRDELLEKVNYLKSKGSYSPDKRASDKLNTWRPKEVCDGVKELFFERIEHQKNSHSNNGRKKELDRFKEKIEHKLTSSWLEIKVARDEACHPSDLELVDKADVHSNLFSFPHTAEVLLELKDWIRKEF